jgi:hypothetical protein
MVLTKKEIGLYLIIGGVAVHVIGNGIKAYNQFGQKQTPSLTDWVYYAATAALVVGIVMAHLVGKD